MWIFYQLEDGLFKTIRCHEYDRTYFGPGEIPDTQGRPAGKTMWAEKFWIHFFWRSHSALMYLNMRGRWSTIKIQDEYFVNTCRMCWDRRLDNPNSVLASRWGWLSGQISHPNLISPPKTDSPPFLANITMRWVISTSSVMERLWQWCQDGDSSRHSLGMDTNQYDRRI